MDRRHLRSGPWSNLSGARLPIADPPAPRPVPCDRDPSHLGGIRFDLVRYGRVAGQIRLCGECFAALNPRVPQATDPLTVLA